MSSTEIILLYAECIKTALPFTIIFYIGDFITCSILRAAFGGRLSFKSF